MEQTAKSILSSILWKLAINSAMNSLINSIKFRFTNAGHQKLGLVPNDIGSVLSFGASVLLHATYPSIRCDPWM